MYFNTNSFDQFGPRQFWSGVDTPSISGLILIFKILAALLFENVNNFKKKIFEIWSGSLGSILRPSLELEPNFAMRTALPCDEYDSAHNHAKKYASTLNTQVQTGYEHPLLCYTKPRSFAQNHGPL